LIFHVAHGQERGEDRIDQESENNLAIAGCCSTTQEGFPDGRDEPKHLRRANFEGAFQEGGHRMIAAQIANLPNHRPSKESLTDVRVTTVSQAEAARQLGTTPKAITQARVVQEFAENIIRRHLTTGQRAMIASKIANLPHGR
jgi:hypothetical protein